MNSKKKHSSMAVALAAAAVILTVAIIAVIVSMHSQSSKDDEINMSPPTEFDYNNHDGSDTGDVIIRNIEINDFDEWGMGVLSNDKYYQIQYGVHVKDLSYVGEQLGTTSLKNQLTSVDGNVYQYSEGASYLIDDNSKYYTFLGDDDVILVDVGDVDTTINGLWVMSPDILPKTSFYDFIERPEDIQITYYPDAEDLETGYSVEEPESFLNSFKRVPSPMASKVQLGYITLDDGSGLIYGALVYYDIDTAESYLCPPTYPKLFFKANKQLGPYLTQYFYSSYVVEDDTT